MRSTLLTRAFAQSPGKTYWHGSSARTYADVLDRSARLVDHARSQGCSRQQRILVVTHDESLLFDILIAGLQGAFVPVFVDPAAPASDVIEIARRCETGASICDSARLNDQGLASSLRQQGAVWTLEPVQKRRLVDRLLKRGADHRGDDLKAQLARLPAPNIGAATPHDDAGADHEEAYVLCTSGSSARPKCVGVSRGALESHLKTLGEVFSYDEDSRVFNILPLHHADGLIHGALTAFVHGATYLRPFGYDLGRTQAFVDSVYQLRATHVIAVPTLFSLVERLADNIETTFGGPNAPTCISTAGPLDPSLAARWQERSGRPLCNVYGLTESVVGACFNGPLPQQLRAGSVGRAVDCELSIRDEQGQPCETGEAGELWLRGPNLATAYIDDEALMDRHHVGGWFRTGDLGFVDEQGFCTLTGRKGNLIVCGGENLSPLHIETAIRTLDGVRDALVFAEPDAHFGEVPHALVELEGGSGPSPTDILDALSQRLAPAQRPRSVSMVNAFVRGPSGKIRRHEAILQHQAKTAAHSQTVMPGRRAKADEAVLRIAADVFSVPATQLTLGDGPDSVAGWDSLGHMRLVAQVEQHFSLRFGPAQIVALRSLRDLVRLVEGA